VAAPGTAAISQPHHRAPHDRLWPALLAASEALHCAGGQQQVVQQMPRRPSTCMLPTAAGKQQPPDLSSSYVDIQCSNDSRGRGSCSRGFLGTCVLSSAPSQPLFARPHPMLQPAATQTAATSDTYGY
jgi:hypothetical protein